MPVLKLFKLLMALSFHSKQNPAHLICLPFGLKLLEKVPYSLLKLHRAFFVDQILPIVCLIVIEVFAHTITVCVYDIASLELEKKALVLREEYLPIDVVHLVALDQTNDIQIDIKLGFATLVEHCMLLSK